MFCKEEYSGNDDHINYMLVFRYEEIYAPEIKDFVYITGQINLLAFCFPSVFLLFWQASAWTCSIVHVLLCRSRIFREGDPEDGGACALRAQVGFVSVPINSSIVFFCLSLLTRFDLGRPLPLHFLRRASKAGGVDSATHTLAKYVNYFITAVVDVVSQSYLVFARYICELGLGVYSLAHIAPSKLSAAALALAIRLVEPSISFPSLWSPALVHYTKYTVEDLGAVITPLAEVLFLAPSAKLGTVYSKFCNKKFMKISRIPLLDDPILRKIAKGEV